MAEKKSIQIKDSYKIWRIWEMKWRIQEVCWNQHYTTKANEVLRRSWVGMYIEWWLHNIGYYLTRNIALFDVVNLRCKDVDLEEHLIKGREKHD